MMPDRFLNIRLFIDANRLNSKGNEQYMNILMKWCNDELIILEFSKAAYEEAAFGNNKRLKKAREYVVSHLDDTNDDPDESDIYALSVANNDKDNNMKKEILQILFPSGIDDDDKKKANKINDVRIVFAAWSHESILVTNDGGSKGQPGGILGNAEKLKSIGIEVMHDEDAVTMVRELIKKRDDYARDIAKIYGQLLPDWVGKDIE